MKTHRIAGYHADAAATASKSPRFIAPVEFSFTLPPELAETLLKCADVDGKSIEEACAEAAVVWMEAACDWHKVELPREAREMALAANQPDATAATQCALSVDLNTPFCRGLKATAKRTGQTIDSVVSRAIRERVHSSC